MIKEAITILHSAKRNGIHISVLNGTLKLKFSKGHPIDPKLLEEIKSNKELIIDFLTSESWKSLRVEKFENQLQSFDKTLIKHIPLSFSQERLWFIDQLEGSVQYHLPALLRLKGELNIDALSYALQEIVNRHEVLRTVIAEEEEGTYQLVKGAYQQVLSITESIYPPDSPGLQEYIQTRIKTPFDLREDLMIRAELIKLNEQDNILLVTMHHIASDGWSVSIIIKELVELYYAFDENRPVELAPLPVQYSDYAIWQRNYLQDAVLETKLNYWKSKLAGVTPLQLPSDFARPHIQSNRGALINFSIGKELADELQALSQERETTLYMTALAAFNVLLYRYSGQHDISVGSPVAGREQDELERLIGFFVNTLVLRTEVKGDVLFTDLLESVKATSLEAYSHQDVPFEKIVEAVVKERDISRNPLFQVMFVLQNSSENTEKLRLGRTTLSPVETTHNTAKFDITFNLKRTANGLNGSIEYSTDLFTEATVQRMADHFKVLLQSVVNDPDQPVGLLKLLTDKEELQLLEEFNATTADYTKDKSIVDLFEDCVLHMPDATALVSDGHNLSYIDINQRSNQLAHYLKNLGVGPETLVAVCITRSVDMIVSMLAILKAGGAYLPIDPEYPVERVKYMIGDSGAAIVITQKATGIKVRQDLTAKILELDGNDISLITTQSSVNPVKQTAPTDLAYVIYTSGSTGMPKGVMIEHASLTNLVAWHNNEYNVTSRSKATSMAGVGFDAFGWEIWPYLAAGAAVYVLDDDKRLFASSLADFFQTNRITHSFLSTALVQEFLNETAQKKIPLEYLLTGGDKLVIQPTNTTYKLVNNYGPTENTVVSTNYTVSGKDIVPPIGKPVSNTKIYILSDQKQLVPVGVPGQLCVGGDNLARGYLNRADLTAEKFIHNPFSPIAGSRLYQTGDIGRWLPDGNIEYLGRADEQVKIRGFRIELGEIENITVQSGMVRYAVIAAKEDENGFKRLVGYVVTDGAFNKADLISFLKKKLPEYMVPVIWMELESIPLTPNGKINKKALPDPDAGLLSEKAYLAPRNQHEQNLADIWKQLLKIEQVGVQDNFFELGGHSLLGMRLISVIRKELDTELAIRDLFSYPTIEELARHLSEKQNGQLLSSIEIKPRPEFIPLSFGQERLWFIDKLEGSTQYHIPVVLRLKGRLDKSALLYALQSLIARHEVLRTVIREADGQAYQFIKDKDGLNFGQIDGSRYTGNPVLLRERVQQLISVPFDLSQDHMLRASLIKLSGEDHVLVVTVHHIAADGWSMSILVKEVVELYSSYQEDRPVELPLLKIQYADYSIWQQDYLQGEQLEKKLNYWKNKLTGVSPLQLPSDYSRPTVQSSRGSSVRFSIDKELLTSLHDLGQQYGTTLFMTLLASFKVLLHRYSGQQDICVGTPIANRTHREVEDLIGFFVNTLALRTDVSSEADFTSILNDVRTTTLEAFEQQDVPFEKVVDAVVNERDMSRNPLFQVMFILQNIPDIPKLRLGELQLSNEGYNDTTAKFDLIFNLSETPSGLHGSVQFSTDLFKEQTVLRMIEHFQTLISSIVKYPKRKIGTLPMLTISEEQQLLVEFNDTDTIHPGNKNIIELFEAAVLQNPDAVAVTFEDNNLTYSKLNEHANKLARYLRKKGVKQEDLVPVCIERSPNMIIGVLGVLKAGAVYVPVDPDYPQDRISYMLADTKASVILSSKKNKSKLSSDHSAIIEIDTNWQVISDERGENLALAAGSDPLTYIIYTSGSTGRPKGVKMAQVSLTNLLYWQEKQFRNKSRHVLQFASLNFDVSFQEIFSTLCFGSTLYLISEDHRKDIAHVLRDIKKHKITHLFVPYIVLKNLAEYIKATAKSDLFLEEVIVAGEQLKLTDDIQNLITENNISLVNQYGPTEAHVVSSFTIDTNQQTTILPPIGKPIDNTHLYILSRAGQLNPVGVLGEICIGGVQVARGYLNLPDLSDARFVDDPFSKETNARMYKTGDMGRWLEDGSIEYLGRVDDQVKIRGYRIELGEIESVLQQYDRISQSVVMAKEDGGGSKRLVGYVVSKEAFNREELMSFMKSKLPEYMIPALWVELKSLPVTKNGKVDKNALPDPDVNGLGNQEYIAPRNYLEAKLAQIWQDLLGVDQVGINDDFFKLGGHSLLAVRIVSLINKELQIELTIKELFLNSAIAELANHIQQEKDTGSLSTVNLKYLIPIKSGAGNLPLYIVSGGGGTVFKFKQFADMLDTNQPVYGIQQPTLDKDVEEIPATIEGIAANYVEELLIQNPEGPYALSGHCVGGTIAYEMARQLEEKGKKVSLLALFDTQVIERKKKVRPNSQNFYLIPAKIKGIFSKMLFKINFELFLLRHHTRQAVLYKLDKMKLMMRNHTPAPEDKDLDIFIKMSRAFQIAAMNYKIQPFDRELLVFYAKKHYYFMDIENNVVYKELTYSPNIKNAWRKYSDLVSIFEIEGEHSTIFQSKYATEFAKILQSYLDTASGADTSE